jgi:hypothetical protein
MKIVFPASHLSQEQQARLWATLVAWCPKKTKVEINHATKSFEVLSTSRTALKKALALLCPYDNA